MPQACALDHSRPPCLPFLWEMGVRVQHYRFHSMSLSSFHSFHPLRIDNQHERGFTTYLGNCGRDFEKLEHLWAQPLPSAFGTVAALEPLCMSFPSPEHVLI